MGLIYDQSDSSDLIKSLGKNLSSAKETVSDLKSASLKVKDSVDGKTLSGAAYTAGAGLFTELIIPTTNRVTTSIDQVQQDLSKYDAADGEISSEGYLDEDNLKNQLQTLKSAKSMLNSSAYSLDLLKHTTNNPAIRVILSRTVNQFKQMAAKKEKQITEVEKKIKKLHTFSSSTKGLFKDSLNNLKIAMQSVTVLNDITVNSDGTYVLPAGADKSWFEKLHNVDDLKSAEKKEKNAAIKAINELYKKNPAAALAKIKNDKRLFGYIISAIDNDKIPKSFQDAVLGIFIAEENWSLLPKKAVTKLVNSPKFALYMKKLSSAQQVFIYNNLEKVGEKGWDVLAPIGYAVTILSKDSAGAKAIASSKIGVKLIEKSKAVSAFLKANPAVKESLGVFGDMLSVGAFSYDEYINPNSPAYGNASKAAYGGINSFLWGVGPLEGAQYGGPVGALAGTANTILQGNITLWPDKLFGFDLPGNEIKTPGLANDNSKRQWLNKLYEQYGKHSISPTDKNYQPGVKPQSGTPNFNPGTQYTPKIGNY